MSKFVVLLYGMNSKLPSATQDDVVKWLAEEMSESELNQIKTWATDAVSAKVEAHLQELCPNLEAFILDYNHLEMKSRSAQWGKQSPGSRVLGMILSKFNAYKEGSGPIAGYFTRKICVRVTAAE